MNRFFLLLPGTFVSFLVAAQSSSDTTQSPGPGYRNRTAFLTNSHPQQQDLFAKDTWQLGFNTRGLGAGANTGLVGRATARVSYFLRDGWALGIEVHYESLGTVAARTSIGLSTRYYFVRDKRLALFGQAGGSVGQSSVFGRLKSLPNSYPPNFFNRLEGTSYQARIGLGVSYRVSRRVALEGTVERVLTTVVSPGALSSITRTTFGNWQGGVGITYRLGK